MYRKLDDFIQEWQHSSKGTISIFEAITDEKKSFEIVEGHNSLEWLSWHLTNSPADFMSLIGLTLKVNLNPTEVPQTMKEITETYKQVSESVVQTVKEGLTDDELLKEVDNHGKPTAKGSLLRMMIDHQTHHRAQMQVLIRQAGLTVPGIMGPTKEAVSSK